MITHGFEHNEIEAAQNWEQIESSLDWHLNFGHSIMQHGTHSLLDYYLTFTKFMVTLEKLILMC